MSGLFHSEEFIAQMLKTNFSFNTNIAIRPIKIVLCPLVKGNGFKANQVVMVVVAIPAPPASGSPSEA